MSIRTLITKPVEVSQEAVAFDGKTYVVRGKPDVTLYEGSLLMGAEDVKKMSAHLSSLTGSEFSDDLTRKCLLVAANLIVPEWDGGAADGSSRYDVSEVAQLAVREMGFFLQLVGAAMKVCKMADDKPAEQQTPSDNPVIVAAVGESGSPKAS
jgi:hypothetical protein